MGHFHSGFCSVIGRPNVGKSTLLNRLIGEKLSIISDKPQTTRNQIHMIYTDDRMQVVFKDTPGVQMPKNELGEAMLKLSMDALDGIDVAIFVTDMSETVGKLDSRIIEALRRIAHTPIIMVLNKLDEADETAARALVEKFEAMGIFSQVLALSAKTNQHVDALVEALYQHLPEGPMYYPEDMITDKTERFVVSEIIREKCLNLMQDEIPHGIFVGIDEMHEREDKPITDIFATIFVEKESHKGMVIGKGGRMLGRIGHDARLEIQTLLDAKVNLKLWVKVERNWRKRKNKLKEFGYE